MNRALNISSIIAVCLFAVVSVGLFAIDIKEASANPSQFQRSASNASAATTTYNSISFGVGTTTINLDGVANTGYDSAYLDMMLSASTTAPQLAVRIEHSYNRVDWYPETVIDTVASSTAPTGTFKENTFTFGTTSIAVDGSAGSGNTNRVHLSMPVITSTRYTRAVIYGVPGGGNGSLYAELVGKQQTN